MWALTQVGTKGTWHTHEKLITSLGEISSWFEEGFLHHGPIEAASEDDLDANDSIAMQEVRSIMAKYLPSVVKGQCPDSALIAFDIERSADLHGRSVRAVALTPRSD